MINKASSTKDEILQMLKLQQKMTVTEMAKQLNITEMAVRRHLNTLEKEMLVEAELVRQAMGRPMYVYQLSRAGEEQFPRNYKSLALDLLKDAAEVGGEQFVDQLFEQRLKRMESQYQQRLQQKTFEAKIRELALIQNENGYMAEWEKVDEETYKFKEYNCPISDVASSFKVACECELRLFKELLQTDEIKTQSCLAKGDHCCQYEIKKQG